MDGCGRGAGAGAWWCGTKEREAFSEGGGGGDAGWLEAGLEGVAPDADAKSICGSSRPSTCGRGRGRQQTTAKEARKKAGGTWLGGGAEAGEGSKTRRRAGA